MDSTPLIREIRRRLHDHGMSVRALARATRFDHAYLCRVLAGKQRPSPGFLEAADAALGADGALRELAPHPEPAPPPAGDDTERMHATIAHLVDLDGRYGGDDIAGMAARVWADGKRRLDRGAVPERQRSDYTAALAEMAEVAGWLAFDAGDLAAARRMGLESHLLAQQCGDMSMERFALTHLAMVDVEQRRPRGAADIADQLLAQPRLPRRVQMVARIRRARAWAQLGDRETALKDLHAARSGLEDSVRPGDPGWTWWVTPSEVSGHYANVYLALGRAGEALPYLHECVEALEAAQGQQRGALHARVSLVEASSAAGLWEECGRHLGVVRDLMEVVGSGRNRRRLRETTSRLEARGAPGWLREEAAAV